MKKQFNSPLAVCLVREGPCGTFLGVTRRNNPASWCFPGGKVEPDESLEDAIIREVQEETGLLLNKKHLITVHSGFDSLVNPYWITAFSYTGKHVLINQTLLQTEKDIQVGFIPTDYLLTGEFGEYNKIVLNKL